MTGKEIFTTMGNGITPSRIPFIPTIYEHSAKVINKTPSEVAQDEDLIVESQLACYETYKHDLIAVGIDIYNIEIEALGAKVVFPNNKELPSTKDILVKNREDLAKLTIPNPEEAGRMPMYLNAVKRINDKVGSEVAVNGAIVGPFTLAAILRGFENFIMDIILDIDFAVELMEFSKKVGLAYAQAFINRGVGLSINESWIAPPLLSPSIYHDHVYSLERDMIEDIKKMGQKNVALISGGNTTAIAPTMIKTGTSLLLADSECDLKEYTKLCKENNIFMRASIASKIVENGNEAEMVAAAKSVIDTCSGYEKFLFGCGIVSYDTEPENVLKLKKIITNYNR